MDMLPFLKSYLAPRTASVVVDGEMSDPFALEDSLSGHCLGAAAVEYILR